jgi:UDP-glucose 4-epimerase
VLVLDSLESGFRAALGDTPLIEGNIKNEALLERVFAEQPIDAVIHFAAYKAPGESMQQPGSFFENNVCGSLTLLRAMQRFGVKYLVFSSTSAVYGTPEMLPIPETAALRPENPYGESKLMVEQMLRWFDRCHGLRSVSLRYFNAAGAAFDASIGEDPTCTLNLIPLVMQVALGKRPVLHVFGTDYPTPDGTAIRDYVHVLDLADAHIKALEYLVAHDRSDSFNLGTSTGWSVQQVLDLARQVTGVDIPVHYTGRRPGDPAALAADTTKARQVLGWQPQYDLETMIQTAWRWHLAHPDGYGRADR